MSGSHPGGARVEIIDSQEVVAFDLERIRAVVASAVPLCLERENAGGVLSGLREIEVSIIDDEAMARVHGEFLDDPTPTDVITFDHGEILVGAEFAARRAGAFGNTAERELALYMVHGLLHLAGFKDGTDEEFAIMETAQEAVLAQVW